MSGKSVEECLWIGDRKRRSRVAESAGGLHGGHGVAKLEAHRVVTVGGKRDAAICQRQMCWPGCLDEPEPASALCVLDVCQGSAQSPQTEVDLKFVPVDRCPSRTRCDAEQQGR